MEIVFYLLVPKVWLTSHTHYYIVGVHISTYRLKNRGITLTVIHKLNWLAIIKLAVCTNCI